MFRLGMAFLTAFQYCSGILYSGAALSQSQWLLRQKGKSRPLGTAMRAFGLKQNIQTCVISVVLMWLVLEMFA